MSPKLFTTSLEYRQAVAKVNLIFPNLTLSLKPTQLWMRILGNTPLTYESALLILCNHGQCLGSKNIQEHVNGLLLR